ncbi:hypothetical protein BGI30_03835 [Snodgrassella alvi]|jgi:Rrf2 family transcriptional regulator, nitric oxide-sensitive transcriptional repressor|uniref:Rrf2 family transcriptional regulator n=1 Tax=Snodgrassella alvi TaxID=1196083 RepID=UPI000C1F2A56|nr:Rrf2 family transcriptional regulator [Snodgrassella alvi]PIT14756.1 hypothetical protein BGI30_03835 [Snodgrassella alvi]PIT30549.1 hypothetical protein BGI37_00120 [Snodgrassella alvi]PIT55187.1 hypothetical protein BHC59_11535 [Snodgrassella alvi]
MQLNRFTDLGLRVLISLQYLPESELTTVELLAKQLNVSRNHLVKIVYFMAQTGWIDSFKGRNGGIRLAAPSHQLKLGDIILALEQTSSETPAIINCQQPSCSMTEFCNLPQVFNEALQAFYHSLNHYTLRQLQVPATNQAVIKWLDQQK